MIAACDRLRINKIRRIEPFQTVACERAGRRFSKGRKDIELWEQRSSRGKS